MNAHESLLEAVKAFYQSFKDVIEAAIAEIAELVEYVKDAGAEAVQYRDRPEYPYIRKIRPIVRVPHAYRAPVRRCYPP